MEVCWKAIKNLHVGVYPPSGNVRVAAPEALSLDAIKLAVLTRMPWIKRKQTQFLSQERQSPRRYVSGETYFVFGRACRLTVSEWNHHRHHVSLDTNDRIHLTIPVGSPVESRRKWVLAWQTSELRNLAAARIDYWTERLSQTVTKWGIRRMKTKWGSCNPDKRTIWINAELFSKPASAIDYVILHELAHFISPRHDAAFIAVLDEHMPTWRQVRSELNGLPLSAWPGENRF